MSKRDQYDIQVKNGVDNWVSYSGPLNGKETASQLRKLKQLFPRDSFRKVRA